MRYFTGACTSCESGYIVSGSSCIESCSCSNGSCSSGSSYCTSCDAGYYLNGQTCSSCPAGYACPGGTSKNYCDGAYMQFSLGGASSCRNAKPLAGVYANLCTGIYNDRVNPNTGMPICTGCISGYYLQSNGWCYAM